MKTIQKEEQLLQLGILPPQATDLEENIIGACLSDTSAYDRVAHILTPECFYKDVHKTIYKCIRDTYNKTNNCDILIIQEELSEHNLLKKIGGAITLVNLSSNFITSANIEHHAKIIYEKYAMREVIRLSTQITEAAYTNFDDMISKYTENISCIDNLFSLKSGIQHISNVLKRHPEHIEKVSELHRRGEISGISTGLNQLNKSTQGWQSGHLIILAARPAMGKTAVALNLFTLSATETGKHVCFFSLEMTDISLTNRLICAASGIHPSVLKTGNLSKDEWMAYEKANSSLRKKNIWIDDTSTININYIRSVAKNKHKKGECDMVVIDYLQLIESQSKNQTRERDVAEMARGLKLLAKDLNIPVILLCQLSRSVENRGGDKKPMLSDLRESGAIEQDADIVLFPYRPEYYGINEDHEGNSLKNLLMLIIAKQRDGETGEILARYNNGLTNIEDYNEQD
jgi:replicative DNA helicase